MHISPVLCRHLSNPCTHNPYYLQTICGYHLSCCFSLRAYAHRGKTSSQAQINEQIKRKSAVTARRNVKRNHKYK